MRRIILYLFCFFIIGCANKAKQKESPQTSINNTIGINDTLGLSLHSEHPVYSTQQKQVTFILHNNSNTDIGVGRGYSYTYEDKKGVWRNVPMQLVAFEEEIVVQKGDRYDVDARLFQHTPGRYRFFYTVRICGKEQTTMMTEFILSNKIDSISKSKPISTEEEQEQPSGTTAFVLQPVPRDIPTGEAINPDSLSMQTEYDYYPLATTEVKLIITNHSHFEYDCRESYSLAYYNSKQKSWETLPTNPIVNSILWIFPSDYPTHEQTIKLYTSKVPNRAGKYRIYKAFNRNTKTAYAEFELVDEAGTKRLRKQMIGTESVNVILTNKNLSQQNLFFGEYYFVAHKQGEQWIPLHDNSLVHDIGIILKPDGDYHFKAKLYPLFNDNTSGQYRVYKEVEFDGTNRKWYMAAEFRIE